MDARTKAKLDEALTGVMHRFRGFFIGPGMNMRPENVPFRHREDFGAPLVTVMGHTYGVRLILDEGKKTGSKAAVEVSVNVYSDEFELEELKSKLAATYRPGRFEKPIENFMTSEDRALTEGQGPSLFASLFSFDVEGDLDLVEKEKETESKVTGKLVDTILRMKYWIRPDKLKTVAGNEDLLKAAVYLYCLRVFTVACRDSLLPRRPRVSP